MGGSVSKQGDDQQTFHKCGISVPIDGSADSDIQVEWLPGYTVGETEEDEEPEENVDDMEADLSDDPFL